MRTRSIIEEESSKRPDDADDAKANRQDLKVELLLDIRDVLQSIDKGVSEIYRKTR